MGSLFGPKPERQIFELIERRDLPGLKTLLEKAPKAAAARHPEHGGTPLHLVAHSGWEAAAKSLLLAGANPNIADQAHGALPLHVALSKGNRPVALRLIAAGSNRNHRHKNDYTPLMVALERRQTDCVEALLNAGLNPMEGSRGMPLLSWACLRWELMPEESDQDTAAQLIRLLIVHGAEVETVGAEGWTALMFAATLGQYAVVSALLEKGADPMGRNEKGELASDLTRKSLKNAQNQRDSRSAAILERTLALLP